jgi:hypothetical protein
VSSRDRVRETGEGHRLKLEIEDRGLERATIYRLGASGGMVG